MQLLDGDGIAKTLDYMTIQPNDLEVLTLAFLSRRFLARLVVRFMSLLRRPSRNDLMRDLIYALVFLRTMRRTAQTSGYDSE